MSYCTVVHSFMIQSVWFHRGGLYMCMLVCQWQGRLICQRLPCCAKGVGTCSGLWSIRRYGLVVLAGISNLSTLYLIQPLRLLDGCHLGGVIFVRALCTRVGWWFLGIECTCCHRIVRLVCCMCKSRHAWCVGLSVSKRGVEFSSEWVLTCVVGGRVCLVPIWCIS